jgi:PIN domain nuclease of toxin-antitoxin system
MRLLLDTHVWLWRFLEPERLSAVAERAVADRGNAVHLSPISAWETLVLARKGRISPALVPGRVAFARRYRHRSSEVDEIGRSREGDPMVLHAE